MNWDEYFIGIANAVSLKSKDPSRKIGAVLVNQERSIISTGYNGFPRRMIENISERWERPIKYDYICHAEENAIFNAARTGARTKDSILYLVGFGPPTVPCKHCTRAIIQAGIVEVIGHAVAPVQSHWQKDLEFAYGILKEVSIPFREV